MSFSIQTDFIRVARLKKIAAASVGGGEFKRRKMKYDERILRIGGGGFEGEGRVKRANVHEDEKLNGLLGKRVRIKWWDGKIEEGVLGRTVKGGRYTLECPSKTVVFYKSHVKKVEEIG